MRDRVVSGVGTRFRPKRFIAELERRNFTEKQIRQMVDSEIRAVSGPACGTEEDAGRT
ncbi:hypothetical protein [Agaricicola taiwanensis]|uniref:hypothetical protein n=1 Tax=Agaricicola taiwanensis TaxID=591372 RepID=UPI00166A02E2|nr:hypothetical protein [Agaricicola taiwanensis]